MNGFSPRLLGRIDRQSSERAFRGPEQPAHELYRRLFEPLLGGEGGRSLLPRDGTIFVAPDGPLYLVPFETLVDDEGRYLVDRYQFQYLGSGRDVLRFREGDGKTKGFYLFAAPEYGEGERFPPLPGTAGLAEVLRGLGLGPDRVFVGTRATEDELYRLERPRWLHLATHGFFKEEESSPADVSDEADERGPLEDSLLRSGLALAGANRVDPEPSPEDHADGVVTALEIATALDLRGTDLVVLSACETGVGDVRRGEGVYGLRRAFQAAGARTLVMSLWRVEDQATEKLMADFYQGLGSGLGKAAALRAAARELKADPRYAHPYFWGAFICAGNPD